MKMRFFAAVTLVIATVAAAFASDYKDGIEYFKADQIDNAQTILERTLNDATTDKAEAFYYLGEIEFKNKNYDAAAKYYEQGLAANPEYRFNLVGQGKLQLMSDAKAASKTFSEALKGQKKNAELQLAVAKAYYETATPGYEKYLEAARKANKEFPGIYVFEGDIFAKDGDKGMAASYYEMAQGFDKDCVEAYIKYCNVYFDINSTMAIAMLEELNKLAPESALAQRELAEAYYKDKKYTKAAVAYEKYVANPNHFAEDRVRLATLLFYGQRYEESTALAQEILSVDPKNFVLHRIMMYNLYETGKYEESIAAGNRFFILTPSKNQVFIVRDYKCYGDAYLKLGQHENAANAYLKAYELNHEEKGNLNDAVKEFIIANKYAEAVGAIDRYIANAGENVAFNDYLRFGTNCLNMGQKDSVNSEIFLTKANVFFEKMTEMAPKDYRGYQRLAHVAATRDPETKLGLAKPHYEKVLEVLDLTVDKAKISKAQKGAYIESYKYLGYYNYLQSYAEPAKANEYKEQTRFYWNKMLEYDPENVEITEALKQL